MEYKTDAYLITCLTNLHVGSGDTNYGVVDNLVQRDPITEVPIIHSSSLKGALREYFKNIWNECDDRLNFIFGRDEIRCGKGDNNIGHYKFFGANLIVFPVRSNKKPFFRATAKFVLKEINEKAKQLKVKELVLDLFTDVLVTTGKPKITETEGSYLLEDYCTENGLSVSSKNILGNDPALFHDDDFKNLVKELPVIARNHLKNGESQNLWYEEVVPRQSRFIFFVSKPQEENNSVKYEDKFEEHFSDNKVIQIGANASIGYGYVIIKNLSAAANETEIDDGKEPIENGSTSAETDKTKESNAGKSSENNNEGSKEE